MAAYLNGGIVMPIFKRCPHCGKRMPEGIFKCPHCDYKREYGKPTGTRALYHTKRWTKLRALIMSMYSCDPYAKSKGHIEPAYTVHHIVPAEEDPSQFWNPGNLIPLSRASHDEVHVAYRASAESKRDMQQLLYSLQKTIDVG